MAKCKYCGTPLKGDWRDKVHVKICKDVSPEVRYIHSGLHQEGWPDDTREPREIHENENRAGNN